MADTITTTFLAAHQPLGKSFTPDGVTPYPLVKKFTSITVNTPMTAEGMEERLAHNRRHAAHGNGLIRGVVLKELHNEPRAGAVDPLATSPILVLDVDNLPLDIAKDVTEFTPEVMATIAETITGLLPTPFQEASCLCSASSSMGTKPGIVSMHLEFWLNEPQSPQWHRNLLRYLNLSIPVFRSHLELAGSGTAFRWKVDPAMASNAQIRYIAVPQFLGGTVNPIPDITARHFILKREKTILDTSLLEIPKNIDALVTRAINETRIMLGMPAKKESMAFIGTGDHRTAVVTNPDRVKMTYVRDTDKFVYYNINDGDSNAYYVNKLEPHVVFNFKGEPPFMFQAAAPEAYQEHVAQWVLGGDGDAKKSQAPPLPLVFRDPSVDTYFNGFVELGTGRILEMFPVRSLKAMEDFLVQRNCAMPDTIPEFSYKFEPHENYTFDPIGKRLNKYHAPEISIETTDPFAWDRSHEWLHTHCPSIKLLLLHALGSDIESLNRFMNWLGTIFQTKKKLTTAWVIQGCQGTGKGILFNHILMPLIGREYCRNTTIDALEEQFNAQFEDALLVMFDEFRLDTSKLADKVYNKLKNMIGEPVITIREMRQTRVQRRVYFNCLFASNDRDVVRIPRDDRRFNVAPRQAFPLNTIVHVPLLLENIQRELPYFAGALGAMIIDINLAEIPLQNNARLGLQELSETTVDGFVQSLETGDFDYFLDVMMMDNTAVQSPMLAAARAVIRRWLSEIQYGVAQEHPLEHKVTNEDLRVMYCVLIAPIDSIKKFGRMLAIHGVARDRTRIEGSLVRTAPITWNMSAERHTQLIKKYITDTLPASVSQIASR